MELLEGETLRGKLDAGPITQKKAVDFAMRLLGKQFVMGETIEDALARRARAGAAALRWRGRPSTTCARRRRE